MAALACPAAADDHVLLAGLRQGHARAFEQLMRRYNRLLFRAARGIVHDDAEAQDVVQEAWLRAFVGLREFRGDASLATWLTRIATNQALTHQRRLGRLVAWEGGPDAADEDVVFEPVADARTPEEEVARRQLARQLEEAIDTLPPIYRSVFILRAVHGLSVDDTASGLEVTHEVVKTRFLRARALLRTRLAGDPAGAVATLHEFGGDRCDRIVASVLAQLRQRGWIRDQ